MSTEASNTQNWNRESSILFIQQEHAKTLKALHEEIATLQKRCTDLTFQLTMHGLTIDEPGTVDSQIQQVQHDLETSRGKISTLEKEIEERDKKVERLEAEARTQRKRWLEESRNHSQTTNSLRAELEAKANTIAYLTTELHRLKQKSRMEPQQTSSGSNLHGTDSVPTAGTGGQSSGPGGHQPPYLHPESAKKTSSQHHFVPSPPQRERSTLGPGSAMSRLRRSGHKSGPTSSSSHSRPLLAVHPSSADALAGRHQVAPTSSQLRLSSGRSSGSESPDISPFIQHPSKEEDLHMDKKQPLPPIAANGGGGSKAKVGVTPVLVHQVISSTSQKKVSPSNTEASIVTLAIGNAAAASDKAWSLAAQDNRSSEYN